MNYKQLITESPKRLVGLKQVLKGIKNGNVRCVVIAADSESFIEECIRDAIGTMCVNVLYCSTRQELGKIVGIKVPCSVVGLA